jgi:hypothetical protein
LAQFVGHANLRQQHIDANGHLYLLDVPRSRVGTLMRGERFVRLSDRYRKRF